MAAFTFRVEFVYPVTFHKTIILLNTSQNIKTFSKYKKGKNERRKEEGKYGWMDGRKEVRNKERKKAAVVEFIHTIWNASILLQLLRLYYFKLPVSDIKQNALQCTLKCLCALLLIYKAVHTYKACTQTTFSSCHTDEEGCGCFNQQKKKIG
jgi:hypothetical protein